MHIGKTLATIGTAAALVIGGAAVPANALRLPPPNAWYAQAGVQCASMNVPKGGREGKVHQWVWKKRVVNGRTELHCEFAGTRTVRS